MSKYNILFSLEKNLYLDGAPVLLEAGALVSNTESGRVHIQLKFKNLSNSAISMIKVGFVLMDSVGREIGRSEKQYIDLKAKLNESFGDKDPAFLTDNTVRKFSAIIEEICFIDGNIWTVPENAVWEKIPAAQSIKQNLTTSEAIDEFKLVYCKQAQFIPFAHKDLWVCSCGNVNKNAHEKCCSCGANFADMESVDNETLKKNNIYRNATALVNKSVSSEIKKGIALFGCIPDWKDSTTKLEEAKQKLILVSQHEKDTQIKNAKQKKKNIIIVALSFVAVIVLIIGISIASSISKANKYEQAQDLMAKNSLSGYAKAMDLLDDLKGYENADDLYLFAEYMTNGEYKKAIEEFNLKEIYIPEGTTTIEAGAFKGCKYLRKIVIPDTVLYIGDAIDSACETLESIRIPNNVEYIGSLYFDKAKNLSYNIDNGIKYLGNESNPYVLLVDAFANNKSTVSINKACNFIGVNSFDDNYNLKTIIIPDSVRGIGACAFYDCDALTNVKIGNGVIHLESTSFNEYDSPIQFNEKNGCLYLGNDESPYLYLMDNKLSSNNGFTGKVFIEKSCRLIGPYAFSSSYPEITEIEIPDSVVSIGYRAFWFQSSLSKIIIPESVKYMDSEIFYEAYNVKVYCKAPQKPDGWVYDWNETEKRGNKSVVWGYTGN